MLDTKTVAKPKVYKPKTPKAAPKVHVPGVKRFKGFDDYFRSAKSDLDTEHKKALQTFLP